jgi:hypothetical protein
MKSLVIAAVLLSTTSAFAQNAGKGNRLVIHRRWGFQSSYGRVPPRGMR